MAVAEMNRIERSIHIRAPRAKVWRAVVTEAEFAEWFHVKIRQGRFEPGARVQMSSTYEQCRGALIDVTIVEMQPERLFSWRWQPGLPDPGADHSQEPSTLVEIRLEDADGGTLVTVTESGFDRLSLQRRAKVIAENTEGWEIQLASLNRYAGALD